MSKLKMPAAFLFLFFISCGKTPQKKPERDEILIKGSELFAKYGCAVCHSLEDKVIYGPPLNGLFMKEVKVLRKGEEISLIADRDYLKKAITDPRFEKVFEYRNKEMPVPAFSAEDAEILVEYLIALDQSSQSGK